MKRAKRYDLGASASGGYSMQEAQYGNWVTWGEYYKLQARHAALVQKLEEARKIGGERQARIKELQVYAPLLENNL